jgi:SAM-dependent methyltransferase
MKLNALQQARYFLENPELFSSLNIFQKSCPGVTIQKMIPEKLPILVTFFMYCFFWISLTLFNITVILWSFSTLHGYLCGAPFLSTPKAVFSKMFELADIKPGEVVYDLGCGDGRFVFEAEARGAKAIGIEISFFVYLLARFKKRILKKQGTILWGNLFKLNLRDADVVFCYLLPKAMKKINNKFQAELKKGCRIICHDFPLPGWRPEKTLVVEGKIKWANLFFYKV